MKQTNAILTCLLAVFFLAVKTSSAAKPNFIIIFADDQGYGDLSCFGSKTIRTPNIDRIAKEGRKFTSFMVASPVCTPSRSALLTGCYPKRVGMHQHVLFPSSNKGVFHLVRVDLGSFQRTSMPDQPPLGFPLLSGWFMSLEYGMPK